MDTALQRRRRFPDLISDVMMQSTSLFRSEVRLARVEMNEKISQATTGVVLAVIGAVLLMPALVILMTAAVAALVDSGMTDAMAALVVGGSALILGAILLLAGINKLKASNLAPRATMNQIQNDAALAREQVPT